MEGMTENLISSKDIVVDPAGSGSVDDMWPNQNGLKLPSSGQPTITISLKPTKEAVAPYVKSISLGKDSNGNQVLVEGTGPSQNETTFQVQSTLPSDGIISFVPTQLATIKVTLLQPSNPGQNYTIILSVFMCSKMTGECNTAKNVSQFGTILSLQKQSLFLLASRNK